MNCDRAQSIIPSSDSTKTRHTTHTLKNFYFIFLHKNIMKIKFAKNYHVMQWNTDTALMIKFGFQPGRIKKNIFNKRQRKL